MDNSVVWPHMLFGPYQCVYGALLGIRHSVTDSEPDSDSTLYRMSQQESARLRESVPYVKLYRYNPKYLYPKLNGYGDNGQRNLKL